MDRDKILEEYRETVAIDSEKARWLIKKLNYRNDPYLLQCIAQTYLDESRFDNSGNLRAKIEWKKWRMAERYIIKAFDLDPNCLIVLYTMGSLRRTRGQNDIAIYCFQKLIKLGAKARKSFDGTLDVDLKLTLINDSKFELYRLYYLSDRRLSKKYLDGYLQGIEKGVYTIYKPLKKFLLTELKES